MKSLLLILVFVSFKIGIYAQNRPRDLGIKIGVIPTGTFNAITDVAGVKVGQITLIEGADVRTGVTAIVPHDGNIFQQPFTLVTALENLPVIHRLKSLVQWKRRSYSPIL